jgi:hypothetical protein
MIDLGTPFFCCVVQLLQWIFLCFVVEGCGVLMIRFLVCVHELAWDC